MNILETARILWWGITEPMPEPVTAEEFVSGLAEDGYDLAVDQIIPTVAAQWPDWAILALRPRFAAAAPLDSRAAAAAAFRESFAKGVAELHDWGSRAA